jgi:RHS repeat-associated protein
VDQYWAGIGGTADVDRFYCAYDPVNNRQSRQVSPAIYPTENMDQAYTYDPLQRLLTSQVGTLNTATGTISGTPASQESWTLDGLANWSTYVTQAGGSSTLNQSRTASPANEISGISASVGATWATPAYDLAGDMNSIPIPSTPTSSYTAVYDAWNRLVSLTSGSSTVATYTYDGSNRRIVKGVYVGGTLDHNEHSYFNESWQVLEVRKEVGGTINANPLEQYVWHPFYLDAPLLRDYDPATSGSPTRYYYTFDASYNVTAATSNTGSPMERYYYSPYGSLTFLDGSFNILGAQQSQIGNALTYMGRQYDAESGLYNYRTRIFHAQLGRFVSRDSHTYKDTLNLYEFVRSSPPQNLDPFGTDAISIPYTPAPENFYPPVPMLDPSGVPQVVLPTPTLLFTQNNLLCGDAIGVWGRYVGLNMGTFAQPYVAGYGVFDEEGLGARSAVTVNGVDSAGGSCNSLPNGDSGALYLQLSQFAPGTYQVDIELTVTLEAWGVGPNAAHTPRATANAGGVEWSVSANRGAIAQSWTQPYTSIVTINNSGLSDRLLTFDPTIVLISNTAGGARAGALMKVTSIKRIR